MKILVSGFTGLQTDSVRRSITKIDVPGYIVKILREAGHTVDWRKLTTRENIKDYDLFIMGIAPLYSIVNNYSIQCITSVMHSEIPTIVFFDDWKIMNSLSNARSIKNPEMYDKWAEKFFVRKDKELNEFDKWAILSYADFLTGTKPWLPFFKAAMIPVYSNWGDRTYVQTELKTFSKIIEFDPSPFVELIKPPEINWVKTWGCAALNDISPWVNKKGFTWPVRFVGNKKLGLRLQSEGAVQNFYTEQIGLLSPEYYHSGSGWFRSRYLYSANAKNVLYCGTDDAAALDKVIGSQTYNFTPKAIENANINQLLNLADLQSKAFWKLMATRQEVKNKLLESIRSL